MTMPVAILELAGAGLMAVREDGSAVHLGVTQAPHGVYAGTGGERMTYGERHPVRHRPSGARR